MTGLNRHSISLGNLRYGVFLFVYAKTQALNVEEDRLDSLTLPRL